MGLARRLEKAVKSLDLYKVATPEAVYTSANLVHMDYRREARRGINLLDDGYDQVHGWSDQPRLDFAVGVQGPVVAQMEQAVRAIAERLAPPQDASTRSPAASRARSG